MRASILTPKYRVIKYVGYSQSIYYIAQCWRWWPPVWFGVTSLCTSLKQAEALAKIHAKPVVKNVKI